MAVGDEVSVSGNVTEFRTSTEPDYLTGTEITSPSAANVVVLSTGNTVAPVILGTDRIPPTQALSALDKGLKSSQDFVEILLNQKCRP